MSGVFSLLLHRFNDGRGFQCLLYSELFCLIACFSFFINESREQGTPHDALHSHGGIVVFVLRLEAWRAGISALEVPTGTSGCRTWYMGFLQRKELVADCWILYLLDIAFVVWFCSLLYMLMKFVFV